MPPARPRSHRAALAVRSRQRGRDPGWLARPGLAWIPFLVQIRCSYTLCPSQNWRLTQSSVRVGRSSCLNQCQDARLPQVQRVLQETDREREGGGDDKVDQGRNE